MSRKACDDRYNHSAKGKTRARRYEHARGRIRVKRYAHSPKGRAAKRKYDHSPKGLLRRWHRQPFGTLYHTMREAA